MAGAHLTICTRNNPGELGNELTTAFAGCTEIFAVGGISIGKWSKQNIRACCSGLNARIRICDTSKEISMKHSNGGVNVFAQVGGGRPSIYWVGMSGKQKRLDLSDFKRI